jgi:hypothetical protein
VIVDNNRAFPASAVTWVSVWQSFWTLSTISYSARILPEYEMMDKVQKHSNPECNTPSSVPFRIDLDL